MYLKIKSENQVLVKHFTILSNPLEDDFKFNKKLTGSDFSQALGALKAEEKVGSLVALDRSGLNDLEKIFLLKKEA